MIVASLILSNSRTHFAEKHTRERRPTAKECTLTTTVPAVAAAKTLTLMLIKAKNRSKIQVLYSTTRRMTTEALCCVRVCCRVVASNRCITPCCFSVALLLCWLGVVVRASHRENSGSQNSIVRKFELSAKRGNPEVSSFAPNQTKNGTPQ